MKVVKKALGLLAATSVLWAVGAAQAETVIKAISAFTAGTAFSKPFESFVNKVNEDGKGVIQIRILGGPESMPPFELGNAVANGVVDMANIPGAFYLNRMPSADALRLSEIPIHEQRQNGAWEYINELHNKTMNSWYLARTADDQPYHLYLTRKIETPDLSRLVIRVSPTYMSFFRALGASAVQTPPGEVYTALERGVVQGYGWPLHGIIDLGWDEVTKYRVDPGFYRVDVNVLVNLDRWKQLGQKEQEILTQAALWLEQTQHEAMPELNKKELELQKQANIETLTFSAEDEKRWRETALRTGWEQIRAQAPAAEVDRLYELLTKKD
ncbi:MAG TPA: TRAP transporter substrate-binding protein DctP [Pusillimonas sp.]|uniref:TRAP transporter substrate-binding protein DctP n=1 Tax=Pusillimonas sp. TaxID=3040095 RepID=UPI002CCE3CB2|nr:TRAP transporter substrate-binding protein DctP [Pusillimonas sp.]HUH88683.1 TRAP transporter substrate-binding protein DctP [Pusillimonas sp.]